MEQRGPGRPFKKGRAKTGGNKKGQVSKRTAEARKQLEEAGWDPLKMLCNQARTIQGALDKLDQEAPSEYVLSLLAAQRDCCRSALPYILPRLRSVEMSVSSPEMRGVIVNVVLDERPAGKPKEEKDGN